MKRSKPPENNPYLPEMTIPREKAVFWMDGLGRWCNRHGKFEHKRIIDHFNHSIRRDQDGYFVTQVRGDIREKVYFPYEETPLFVIRIVKDDPIALVLNTGETISLEPARLFVKADHLYQRQDDKVIKFTDRALLTLAPYLEDETEGFRIRIDNQTWPIMNQGPL